MSENTAGSPSSSPTVCLNSSITNITIATTGATGISDDGVAAANGLPGGVSASWSGDVTTISGTPTATGTFNYTIPLTGGCGTVTATGTITITDTNQVPIANDMTITVDEGVSIQFTLDATDEDGDSLSKTIVSQPDNGSLIPGTGLDYTYNPDSGYFGTDSFTYKVNDGTSDSEIKTVTINVNQVLINISI